MLIQRRMSWNLALVCLMTLGTAAPGAEPVNGPRTPLDEYVARPDNTYDWKVVETIPGEGYTTFIIDMKSLTWRTLPDVDRSVWQHWLVVVKPDVVKHETAFLNIGGGRNGSEPPKSASAPSIVMATTTNSVVAELRMIPNQPLTFDGDGKGRNEDDLIAYCWIKFMDSGDPTWIPRLPMVKSTVRAMDTVAALLKSAQGGKAEVNKFVVAGGSKRGWTTWLTGAVDKRVVAIMPIVIDIVNVEACSINHFCAYGFWAPAIGDYTRHKVMDRRGTPEHAALMRIEDPFYYRNRFTMPKYIINSSGDQFFPPDSSKFYYDELPGEKHLRYVPNSDHSLRGTDAYESILSFYHTVLTNKPRPKFAWKMQADGVITVNVQDKPLEVNLWQATNPKARDFRLMTIGQAYQKSRLEPRADGSYVARVAKPESGWTAYFVELVYDSGIKVPLKFTTQVGIVPDVLPHKLEEPGK